MPPYYRSKAIWDETRQPNAPVSSYIRAILYELQPMRLSSFDFKKFQQDLKKVIIFLTQVVKFIVGQAITKVKNIKRRELRMFGIIIIYVYGVLLLHRLYDVGVLIVIITVLTLIYTIGLSDNDNDDGISAYSVFNRGFRQMLGNLDANNFVNQYVQGGVMMAGAVAMPPNDRRDEQQQEDLMIDDFEDDDDDEEIDQQQQPQQRSRKSGKKARRRNNVEQRREAQRQRQLARDMAWAGENE